MKKTLSLNDYLRVFSRTMVPLARGMTSVLALNDYVSGRGQAQEQPERRSRVPSPAYRYGRRAGRHWVWENSWGYDPEVEHFERELWTEQSFFFCERANFPL
jgi:hypothetical protein